MWRHIEWEPDRPNTAAFRCPHCETLIDESHNPAMVGAGTWRATHPEVTGHHGYRLNSLVSLLPNVSWTVLAREFLQAKDHRDRLMSFITTKLAEPWREQADESSEGELAARPTGAAIGTTTVRHFRGGIGNGIAKKFCRKVQNRPETLKNQ
jgi:phage terminase large subunit GpA-like protein